MSKLTADLTYDYLSAEAAPTREERIEATYAFGGSCTTLKHGMGQGCTKYNSRKFAQGGGCQLNLALGIVRTFQNSVIIIHGPLGCASNNLGIAGYSKTFRVLKQKQGTDNVWIHTNLDENDVIAGGIDKLRQAILYAEKEYRPDAIIIGNSCVPGIIGDDIDSLIDELDGQLSARVVPVHCEGFKSKFVATGYDSAYHGVLKKLVDPIKKQDRINPDDIAYTTAEETERYINSKTVNLLNVGSTSFGDEFELSRLLKALGLTVRVLPLYASIDEISRIGEAALNVSICATHDDYLIGHLKERFGTDYVIDTLPIGIKNTNQWLRVIARFFKLEDEAEKLIAIETAQLEEALVPFKKELQGKTVFVGGGETRIFTTAEFYQSLGMKVLGLKPHNFDRFAVPMIDDIDDQEAVIDVAPGQPSEELVILNRLKPDLYVGHVGAPAWVTKLGIPNIPLFGQSLNYMGYSGAFELARKAVKSLKNTNFPKKIAANVPLPFRPEWYASNPFDNIKEAQQG
ncbi:MULTISPECIES: nitrogenase component 1 [Sporomusa]|jgi:nitrogenase molybdenum-iron protein alpha chain|uniref:Nitrogenase vanadium-iron protein alpha chain n=1 Tax=Sporomusa silvacetica DSM 10669 TaxID=1123289 RepID=A0ABZ3IH71_9FIRM|nr:MULTISPECIES: nitrogenase component 1 [Sporomusa]OZC14865.1 nitrogenase vanadium-iron protein alpha chain [Sporomusa silvacetica DSM 10669]TWH47562.1 nitrogenase molybdenum-iron protein alpha chain [Sporomusa sp. KB1]